tara:strand:- start:12 stop:716 length:705 start_codon:yes stop_codon:yes gene_type:complete
MDAGTSLQDVFGCLDTDGDGWSDAGDDLPEDPTQYLDADMDGYGDSMLGNFPDSCPGLFGLSSSERFGCPDTDGDGWDDNLDVFPADERFWSDNDGDGHPDQTDTNLSDDCPDVAGTSTEDRIGCPDADADGWSDEADAFPQDASRHVAAESSSLSLQLGMAGLALLILISLVAVFVTRRGGSTTFDLGTPEVTPQLNAPMITSAAPPLPPEGLPAGWTMEQWAWYGEEYLKNR